MPSPFDPTAVRDIDDVIDALGAIVAEARERGERFGLFAALYRRTTQEVRRALRTGAFHDPAWVERLDVVFAHRYLQAFADFHAGLPTTAAWAHAFERDREPGHLALQHLMLGMAAHILLDLGVATHDTCDGPWRHAGPISSPSPGARRDAGRRAGRPERRIAGAGLGGPGGRALGRTRRDRHPAPLALHRLAPGGAAGRGPDRGARGRIERIDQATLRVARGLCAPADSLAGAATGRLLGWVGRGEPDDVPALIDAVTGRIAEARARVVGEPILDVAHLRAEVAQQPDQAGGRAGEHQHERHAGAGADAHERTEHLGEPGARPHRRLHDPVGHRPDGHHRQRRRPLGDEAAGGEHPPLDVGRHLGLPDRLTRAVEQRDDERPHEGRGHPPRLRRPEPQRQRAQQAVPRHAEQHAVDAPPGPAPQAERQTSGDAPAPIAAWTPASASWSLPVRASTIGAITTVPNTAMKLLTVNRSCRRSSAGRARM